MKTRYALVIFILLTGLAALGSAQPEPELRTVLAHVMLFQMNDETGVVEPKSWHQVEWPGLRYETEQRLAAVLGESDDRRRTTSVGHLAIRAHDGRGKEIFRSVVTVPLWYGVDGREHEARWGDMGRIKAPAFTVVVPDGAEDFSIDGWMPATRSTFRLDTIAAQFAASRVVAQSVEAQQTPIISLDPTKLNLVILGDGYRQVPNGINEEPLFHQHAQAAEQVIFSTPPYNRYRQFWSITEVFTASQDSGAAHPVCSEAFPPNGNKIQDPLEPTPANHSTAFDSAYCAFSQQKNLVVNQGKVQAELTRRVAGNVTAVLVLVNDGLYGGTGRPYAIASANTLSAYIALHELAHTYPVLADEYDYRGAGGAITCSDLFTNTPCEANVTNNNVVVKWQRWINGVAQICPNVPPQNCGFTIGLWEGANTQASGWYRPEKNCLMRTLPSPTVPAIGFCSICTEEHIRAFYTLANPFVDPRSFVPLMEHPELRDTIVRPDNLPPVDVHIGGSILLGVHPPLLNIPPQANPATDPNWKFTWYLQGVQLPHTASIFSFSPAGATTYHIQVDVEDPTPLVRADAAHPLPRLMHKKYGWNVVTDAAVKVASSGTATVSQQSPVLTVPQGTRDVTLTYSLATLEPNGSSRPGDFWSVTVAYAGTQATALAAAPLPYHAEGVITAISQNGTFTIPLSVDARTSDVQLVVQIQVKNLESDNFVPTEVTASIAAVPTVCSPDCDYCDAHPDDPNCPIHMKINSADLVPEPADTPNSGDSSYFSLGELLGQGRHAILNLSLPSTFKSLRVVATALATNGTPLMDVRDVTWFLSAGPPLGGTTGLERDRHNASLWDLNISPKKVFTDVPPIPSFTEDQWQPDIAYRITATVTMPDGRTAEAVKYIDRIVSPSSPSANDAASRPLHALWHSTRTNARSAFWSSVANNNWLKTTALAFHIPDRIAGEDAMSLTPAGHETGAGITEVPFYPGAKVVDATPFEEYDRFRSTANNAVDGAPVSGQPAAREVLVKWINDTRAHLEAILPDGMISEVRVGDGGACGRGISDRLPEGWMRSLLVTGRIIAANGHLLLDLSNRVAPDWAPPGSGKLTFTCVSNIEINILVDRCKIGDIRGPCIGGRPPGKRTTIVSQPQPTSITPGQSALLSVGANGDDLRYQWYVGNAGTFLQPVPNATASTVTVQPGATTPYWVLVSGAFGDVFSTTAIVSVAGSSTPCTAAPAITQQPVTVATVATGASVPLQVGASGENLRYQWYVRDVSAAVAITGATSATFAATAPGQYFARVYNECGTAESTSATVVLESACASPSVTISASALTATPGGAVTLTAAITGKEPISIVWYEQTPSGDSSSVGTTAQVVVRPPADGTQYYIGASNECSVTFSQPVVISICAPPHIVQPPAPPVFSAPGQTATISVSATGTALHYAWSINGAPAGEDAASLVMTAPDAPASVSVRVYNACGSTTSDAITVNPACLPPAITAEPQPATIVAGGSASLSVLASGTQPFSIEWRTTGGAFAGAGAVISVSPAQTTAYVATVTNACGQATTAPATVTVTAACEPPAVTQQPQSTTLTEGASATLSVTATGTDLGYQWSIFDAASGTATALPNETARTLTVSPAATTSYLATVSNSCGTAQSAPATITVTPACVAPAIAANPQPVTVTTGTAATLSVVVTGTAPVAIQWYDDLDTPVGQGTSITFTPAATKGYYAVATNACGSVRSATALVTVTASCEPPAIVVPPASTTITAGASATLTALVTGTNLHFQWFTNDGAPVPGGTFQALTVTPASTTAYYVVVSNACGTATSQLATVTVTTACAAPAIIRHPLDTSVRVGATVTLSVTAVGDAPLAYQWYMGLSGDTSAPLLGQTQSTLTATPSETTTYWVRVTNACGGANSVAATVVVTLTCVPPSIVSDVSDTSVTAGGTATVSIEATGTAPLSYQWYVGISGEIGSLIPNATDATLTYTPDATTTVWAFVTNACGAANSSTATITVVPACAPPQITKHPASVAISAGAQTTLSFTATGTAPLAIQWYIGLAGDKTHPIENATRTTLTVTPDATTSYWAKVGNACGTVNTKTATVTVTAVCVPPAVTVQPAGATITLGDTITLSAAADGTAPLEFQWYEGSVGDTSVPLAAAETLDVTPAQTTSYWARITNACGSVDTSAATVTVTVPCDTPFITAQPQSSSIVTGGSATLSVAATGSTPLGYQWYTGATGNTSAPLVSGTSDTITVTPTATTSYWVRVTNSCGAADSDAATVTVTCSSGCGGGGDGGGGGGGPKPVLGVRLPAPTDVRAVAKPHAISVTWREVNNTAKVAAYQVWRFNGTAYVPIGTTRGTTFNDKAVASGTQYSYFVVTISTDGVTSAPSSIVSAIGR